MHHPYLVLGLAAAAGMAAGQRASRPWAKGEAKNWRQYVQQRPATQLPPPIPGMEGPFEYGSGHVLYWDAKEGAYYDRGRDMYVEDEEIDAIMLQQGRGARAKTYNEEKRKKQLYSAEPFNYAEAGDRVKVHLNLGVKWKSYKIKTWSVKDERASVTLGHARRVVLKDAVFHVGRSGAKRALGGEKTVHAWVDGTLVSFMLKSPAKRSYKTPATATKLRYNPHKGHTAFMREDSNGDYTIPVASAKKVFLDPDWGVYATGVKDARMRGAAARGLFRSARPDRSTVRLYQEILSALEQSVKRDFLATATTSIWQKEIGGVTYVGSRSTGSLKPGFYVGTVKDKRTRQYRGGIGPFKTTYEATMAIWHMEQSGVRGQRAKSHPGGFNALTKLIKSFRFQSLPDAAKKIHVSATLTDAEITFPPAVRQELWMLLSAHGYEPVTINYGPKRGRTKFKVELYEPGYRKKAGRRAKSSRVSKCISFKVREEGWEQRRAVAACQNMNRSKRLRADGSYIPKGSKR